MNRSLTIPLDEILSLVVCAGDYGFRDEVLMSAFAEWTGPVNDADIAAYADWYISEEARQKGYTDEDREQAIELIEQWRDEFITNARRGPTHEPRTST